MELGSTTVEPSTSQETTGDLDEDSLGFYPPIDVPLIVIGLLILMANLQILILILKKETLRKVTANIFLGSLATCDFVSGVFGIPLIIGCSATHSDGTCITTAVFIRFSAVLSVLHLLCIAIDRYVMVVNIDYETLVTHKKAIIAVISIWLFSLLVALIQLSWYDVDEIDVDEDADERTVQIEKIYFIICLVLFYGLPLLLMCYCYGRIFSISLRHILAIRKQRVNLHQLVPPLIVELRGSVILATMMVVFAGCWLPYFMAALQEHMGDDLFVFPVWSAHLLVFLRFTPPLLNPLLCTFCKRDFRKALFASFKRAREHPPHMQTTLSLLGRTKNKEQDSQQRRIAAVASMGERSQCSAV